MSARFTIDGNDALERQLAELCQSVRDGVTAILPRPLLHALVLGGGYGRGEGGVLRTNSGDEPYNDLEFYLLIRGSELLASRLYRKRLHGLAHDLSVTAGIEVEFKMLALRKLQRSPVTMFYYDLVSRHRVIAGPENWSARCEHHRAAHRIPLSEATRLLMNRCSGLLFAQERLSHASVTGEDADFVGRNLAKAKLAFGDVILTMRGLYHWSCLERHKRLRKLAAESDGAKLASLLLLHEQGIDFKLHPIRTQRAPEDLRAELSFLKAIGSELWLQLERRRLHKKFSSLSEYAADRETKCPETHALKNRLVNARTFGMAGLADSRYPRERLLRALPALLWEPVPGAAPIASVSEYEAIWRNFN